MAEKIVIIADPGIDGAFAIALAFFDPNLAVLGLGATAGNVSAEQATKNIHILVDQLDPPRWPRLGEAPDIRYDIDGRMLHGPTGLGNTDFPAAVLHNIPTSEKLLGDLVRPLASAKRHRGHGCLHCVTQNDGHHLWRQFRFRDAGVTSQQFAAKDINCQ